MRIHQDNVQKHQQYDKLMLFIILALFLFVALYVYGTWYTRLRHLQEHAIIAVQSAEAFFDAAAIEKLDANKSDPRDPSYSRIKSNLLKVVNGIEGVKSAYLLSFKHGQPTYMVESASTGEQGFTNHRQVLSETDVRDFVLDGKPHVVTSSREGGIVSVLIPVKNNEDNVVALFGADYPTSLWSKDISLRIWQSIVVAGAVVLSVLLIYIFYRKKNEVYDQMRNTLQEHEALFRTVFDQAPIGIAIGGDDNQLWDVNPMFEKLLGRNKEELSKLSWKDYTHPEDLPKDLAQFERFTSGEIDGYAMEKRYIRPDGSILWVNMTIAPLYLPGGDTSSHEHLCLIKDISERIDANKALHESERSKSVLLANLPGMAYRCQFDHAWTMQFVSEGCFALTGYEAKSLLFNRELSYNELILEPYRNRIWDEWNRALSQKGRFQGEYEIVTATKERKWVLEVGQGIFDERGNVEALEGIVIDITERKNREAQIQYMNDHDSLTGLYNRRYFESEMLRYSQEPYLPLSILVMDINGVRLINDAFGHYEGDLLIVTVAGILKKCCREADILARIGGDEFGILLPRADSEMAHSTMERIRQSCAEYNDSQFRKTYDLDLSIGYATKFTCEESIEQIVQEAEAFMRNRKLLNRHSSYSAIVASIMATVYEKSEETESHAQRIATLCQSIGEKLELSDKSLGELQLFAMLHDIGKVGIEDGILNKPDHLTQEEWAVMIKHPDIGYRIAMSIPELMRIADFILSHHERWDGGGYPHGLKGEEIPLLSRILAIVDAYDAMTQDRVYRKAMEKQQALDEIEKNAGTQFDPVIAELFLALLKKENPPGGAQ